MDGAERQRTRGSRRGFVALGSVALLMTGLSLVSADSPGQVLPEADGPGYQLIDRWALREGGYGMYVAVRPDTSRQDLEQLGERIRIETSRQPAAVVMVFDDVEAARTVRSGARIVGNEAYERAITHQVASYVRTAQARDGVYTILR